MPVKRRSLLWTSNLIVHSNLNGITPIRFNGWARKLSIDQYNILLISVGSNYSSLYSEIIVSNDSSDWRLGVGIGARSSKETPRKSVWQRIVGEEKGEVGCLEGSPRRITVVVSLLIRNELVDMKSSN